MIVACDDRFFPLTGRDRDNQCDGILKINLGRGLFLALGRSDRLLKRKKRVYTDSGLEILEGHRESFFVVRPDGPG